MPAFPRFLGGPKLGSNLGDVTTAKAAIVGQLLAIIFPGIVMYLMQGSPSGSSASGGTHADEIGDAADWVYRYPDGRTVPLIVYLVASLLWRMLDCLSYVRGADVDKNGVKDDPFSLHNHIIDREGGPKVQAVRDQIALYVRHLDGLVGGRADREAVVPTPMTLAEYQTPAGQATFLFRFQQLTSEALGLAAHIEPNITEDDMPRLLLAADGQAWLASDRGITPLNMLEAQAIHRVLTATEYDPGSATLDKVDPAQLTRFAQAVARLNPPAAPAPAASVDVAALAKAIAPLIPASSPATVDVAAIAAAVAPAVADLLAKRMEN